MTHNRLEIILVRNQRNVVMDLLLALVFVAAAAVTGLAMRAALYQLAGAPSASGAESASPDRTRSIASLAPCRPARAVDVDSAALM